MRHTGAQGISLICDGAQGNARSDCEEHVYGRAGTQEESLGHALEGPSENAVELNAQRHVRGTAERFPLDSKTKNIWNCRIECFQLPEL